MKLLKTHVCERFQERFGVKLSYSKYLKLNKIASETTPMYPSAVANCNFRKFKFEPIEKDIVCIYDTKLNRIKTVLLSNEVENLKLNVGRRISCRLVRKDDNHYLMRIDNSGVMVAMTLNFATKEYVKDELIDDLVIISNRKDKKGRLRIHVRPIVFKNK